MLKRLVKIWLAALFLIGCEPEATPLPVDIVPTTSSATVAPAPQTIRYAIDPAALLVLPPGDYALIAREAEIETVSPPFDLATLGSQYDIMIALGDLTDGERLLSPVTISLALNTGLAPLNDSQIAAVVSRAVNTEQFAAALNLPGAQPQSHESEPPQALRNEIANLGFPDGFDLSLTAVASPGADLLQSQLAVAGISTQVSEIDPAVTTDLTRSHLILFTGSAERLATDEGVYVVIALAEVPISYRVAEGITVEFTAGGIPLARR